MKFRRHTTKPNEGSLDEHLTTEPRPIVDRLKGESRLALIGFCLAVINGVILAVVDYLVYPYYYEGNLDSSNIFLTGLSFFGVTILLGTLTGLVLSTITSFIPYNQKSYDERWSKGVLVIFVVSQVFFLLENLIIEYGDWFMNELFGKY